jgi:uncharacterized membrane protein
MLDRKSSREKTLLLVQFSILLAIEAIVCFTPLGSIPLAPPLIVATLGMIPVIIAGITLGLWAGALMGFFAGLFSFIVWTFMPPSIMAFVFTPFATVGGVHGNFWSILICFAPRIGVGIVSAGLFILFNKIMNPDDTRGWPTYLTGAAVSSAIVTAVVFIITYIIYTIVLKYTMATATAWLFVAVIFAILCAGFYFLFKNLVNPAVASDIVAYGASAAAGSMTNTVCVLGGIYIFFGPDYAQVMGIGYDTLLGVIGLSVVTNGVPEAIVSVLAAFFIARTIMRRKKHGDLL